MSTCLLSTASTYNDVYIVVDPREPTYVDLCIVSIMYTTHDFVYVPPTHRLPLYYELKIVFVLWLVLPITEVGPRFTLTLSIYTVGLCKYI